MEKREMIINLPPNKKSRELLDQFHNKELSLEDFSKECAYWLLEYLPDFTPFAEPNPPQEILDWQARKANNPTYETKAEFWKQEPVWIYMTNLHKVKSKNSGNLSTLLEFRRYIPEDDIINRNKYNEIIRRF